MNDTTTDRARAIEALWRALDARCTRIAREQGEERGAEKPPRAEFEELPPGEGGDLCVVEVDEQTLHLTRPELMVLGAAAAVALGLGDDVLGELALGLGHLTVGDLLTLLDPLRLHERVAYLRYLGGGGRLMELGVLRLRARDGELDAGAVIHAHVVITAKGLRAFLGEH